MRCKRQRRRKRPAPASSNTHAYSVSIPGLSWARSSIGRAHARTHTLHAHSSRAQALAPLLPSAKARKKAPDELASVDRRTCQSADTRTSAAKRERTQLSTRAADFTAECGSSSSKTSRTGAELRLTLSLGAANGVENGLPHSKVLVSLLNKSLLPPPSPPSRGAAKRKRCCMGSVQHSVPAVVEQAPGGRARRRLVFYAAA